MQALEPYAASGNVDLSHDDEAEYSHAKEYFHRRGSGNTGGYNRSKVGTLSKSEWEAISELLCKINTFLILILISPFSPLYGLCFC